jgi:regulator of sirC expression with transglutaminase-like and TPR domain
MAEQPIEPTAQQRALRAFETLIAGDNAAIDLAQAAFLIAEIEYPNLDTLVYFAQLDALARRVGTLLALPGEHLPLHIPQDFSPFTVIQTVNTVLFEQEGFHGNREDYYNTGNSFLNKVLETHVGIPITLSLLYMEVCKRIGFQVDGIGLPFHFVLGHRLATGTMLYIDPFEHGECITEQQCRERIRSMAGGRIRFHAQWFEPVSHRNFLIRMLTNLKHIYIRSEQHQYALAVCDRLVLLAPNSAFERRDRGVAHLQLRHYGQALRDLKAYTELAPDAQDRDEILEHIKTIRQTISMMN